MIDLRIILLFIFRIILFSALTWGGYWVISHSWIYIFYSLPSVVIVYGILNIWAGFGCFFVGAYVVLYLVKELFKFSIYMSTGNKAVLFIGLILSPLLAIITYQQIHSKLDENGYTECHDLQRISTRYISNTYTKTPELCAQLVAEK